MVDPHRKINNLTDEHRAFLTECEEEFTDRYTEKDTEYSEYLAMKPSVPPLVDPWQGSQKRTYDNYRGGGGYNNRGRYNNRYHHHHHRGGGGRYNNRGGGGGYDRQHNNRNYNNDNRNSYGNRDNRDGGGPQHDRKPFYEPRHNPY